MSPAIKHKVGGAWADGGEITHAKISGSFVAISGFDPTSVGDVRLWLDATTITGQADDTALASWSDLSGNGNNAAAQIANPKYRTASVGGMPGVEFTGPGTGYYTFGNPLLGATSAHAFVVCQWKADNPSQTTDSGFWWFGTHEIAFMPLQAGNFYDEFASSSRFEFGRIPGGLTRPRLYAARSGTDSWKAYYERTLHATASARFSFNTTPRFGRSNPGPAGDQFGFNGYLGELIIFGEALADTPRQSVETYLIDKWGITV